MQLLLLLLPTETDLFSFWRVSLDELRVPSPAISSRRQTMHLARPSAFPAASYGYANRRINSRPTENVTSTCPALLWCECDDCDAFWRGHYYYYYYTREGAHTQQQTSSSKTNKNGVDFAYAQQYERAINKCEKMKMAPSSFSHHCPPTIW